MYRFYRRLLIPVLLVTAFMVVSNKVTADSANIYSSSSDSTKLGATEKSLADNIMLQSQELPESESLYPISAERRGELAAYSRFKNIWRFVSIFVSLGVLLLFLFTGLSSRLRNWAKVARREFFILWLFLILFLTFDYLLNFPFHVYRSFVVEGEYGFMNQTFWEWLGEDLLGLAVTMVVAVVPLWLLYFTIRRFKRWWLAFSIVSIPLLLFLIVLAPVVIDPIFNDYTPLKDKKLESGILELASRAGIDGSYVFQVNASKQSNKINAYVTGLFGTKRIVLYDTLIKNFSYEEIRFVMGHEMGHYVLNHIWWFFIVAVLYVGLALWVTSRFIDRVIARFASRFGFSRLSDIASLPLLLIFFSLISFFASPILNGISRYNEHQSDIFGMDVTGVSGETAAVSFDKLSVFNLSDPDPHPLIEFWFYSHPSLKKRIEFVRSYRPPEGRSSIDSRAKFRDSPFLSNMTD